MFFMHLNIKYVLLFLDNVIQSQYKNMMVKYVPVEAPAIVSGHLYLDQHYKFNSVLHKFRGGSYIHYIIKRKTNLYNNVVIIMGLVRSRIYLIR